MDIFWVCILTTNIVIAIRVMYADRRLTRSVFYFARKIFCIYMRCGSWLIIEKNATKLILRGEIMYGKIHESDCGGCIHGL